MSGVNQLGRGPNADLDQVFSFIREEVKIEILSRFNARDLVGSPSDGDLAIAVSRARVT